MRALAQTSFGRVASGFLLYAHPERQSAEAAFGDALGLKYATAFERTAKQGVTYKFDSQVPVPATIAWATKDRILPYSQSQVAKDRLPAVHHVPLPGCGHVPIIDDPVLVTRVIEETIARA